MASFIKIVGAIIVAFLIMGLGFVACVGMAIEDAEKDSRPRERTVVTVAE